MTAPLHPEPDPIVLDAQQFDVASVRVELRADPIKRLGHPDLEVVGVKAVEQEQVGGELVPGDRLHDRAAGRAGRGDGPDEIRQGRPVEFEKGLDDLAGLPLRGRVGEPLEVVDQGLDPGDPAAEVVVGRVHE